MRQSFFANIGVLFEEVTKANWAAKTTTELFSHNVQQKDTQQVDPNGQVDGTGVLGRLADALTENGYKTGSFSISGDTYALVGRPFESPGVNYIDQRGVVPFNNNPTVGNMGETLGKLNNPTLDTSGKYAKTWSDMFNSSVVQTDTLSDALVDVSVSTVFPNTVLGRRLQQVASVMKARDKLGHDRQLFYVDDQGWDTHLDQNVQLPPKMRDLNSCIDAFKKEMKLQGLWDNVVFVMASDFGRTLTPNAGSGTDHAWGGKINVLLNIFQS